MQPEIIQAPDLVRAEARMPRWMIAIAVLGTSASLLTGHSRVAGGLAVGAAIGIMNYYWLHEAVAALMSAGHAHIPKRVVVKMLVRYPLAFLVMYWFYRTGWLPIMAVVGGLLVPAMGVFIESLFLISAGLRRDQTA